MPSQHKHKLVGIRGAPEELVEKVRKKAPDGNLSKVTIELWHQYVSEDDAKPPKKDS